MTGGRAHRRGDRWPFRRRRREESKGPREPRSESPAEETSAALERATRELSAKERILDLLPEGVLLTDPSGEVVYANASARDLITSAPLVPRRVAEGASEIELRHPVARTLRVITGESGGGLRLSILRDITEERRVESLRRDFVANVSHELKTPVAGILASAETLEASLKEAPDKAAQFAAALSAEAQRLSEIVEDLLSLARLEAEAPVLEQVDLSQVVGSVASVAQYEARQKSLDFRTTIEPGVNVVGIAKELSLATKNLIENAIRYTEKGFVEVVLGPEGPVAVLEVGDSGVGIPAKDLARIFERFYRADKARSRDTGGTGLGLSIVKHVAERHGGEVFAESELGVGSRFVLKIPIEGSASRRGPIALS